MPPRSTARNNTTQSKTRKEYVDITDGSDISDKHRKVHRIDLAADDQEDIQKQIQKKLSRIQQIFQGQQIRQGAHDTNSMKDQVTSGTGLSRLHDDDASFNDRISQPTKDRHPDSTNYTGLPHGSKNNMPSSSLPDLNGHDGGTITRMSSNPTGAILKSENQSKVSGRDYDSTQQRRKSLSNNLPQLSSYDREHEVRSRDYDKNSYKRAETGDFGGQHQSFYRPGEMRYSVEDSQEMN